MDAIQHPSKGIMLDARHLLHMNLNLRTQEEGIGCTHSMLDAHGNLCHHILGVHLIQSLASEYCEQMMQNPPDPGRTYAKRCNKMFRHAFAVDQHLPFTCVEIDRLIRRIAPEYPPF